MSERKPTDLDMPSEAQDTKATLAHLASTGAHAEDTARMALTMWSAMDTALSPIIGQRGFAALYKRSLQLTRTQFSWLASIQEGVAQVADFAPLNAALAEQTGPTAVAASVALLETFYDLLTNLIGRSLTDRLLISVWEKPTSGHPAQDTSP